MKDINLALQDGGVLNSVYDKIYNCRVVKPTYHKNAVSSQKIMLDKRLGLTEDFWKPNYKFTDTILVDWEKYYYWIDNSTSKWYISNKDWLHIYEVPVDSESPVKISRGIWAGWQLIKDGTESWNALAPAYVASIPVWASDEVKIIHDDNVAKQKLQPSYKDTDTDNGWFIKLTVSWASAGQYITFTSWILKGTTNKIWYSDWTDIYILGTNIRWTLPETDVQYRVFSESRETIVVWASDWLHVVSITDRDDSTQNKYIISLATWIFDHWTFKVDWHDVFVTTNDPTAAIAEIDALLPATYTLELIDDLIHIERDDGSIINFSELYTWVLVDSQMIGWDRYWVRGFWGIVFEIDGHEIVSYATAWDDNTAENTSFVNGRYRNLSDEDKDIEYQYFYKNDMLNDINSKLPAGYTWTIVSVGWESEVTHRESYDSEWYRYWRSRTYGHDKRLFIKKDDNSSISVNKKEFYYSFAYFDDRSKTVAWYTWISLHINDKTFTVNVSNNHYHHGIGSSLRALVAADPDLRVSAYGYDSDRDDGWFLVSYRNGDPVNMSMSYPGTDPWETYASNYTTTYADERYTSAAEYSNIVNTININAVNAYWVKTIVDEPIIDVVNYNGVIHAMTKQSIYFSRLTFDDNTSFYPLDRFPYKGWQKLIPFGKVLLVMWVYNKIITTSTTTLNGVEWVITYRINDLEYNGRLFSRYAYLFDEGAMYVLQDDKSLVQLNVSQKDSNTFTITTQELSRSYRWLFEYAVWECYVTRHNNSLNFMVVDWESTINYKFNLSLQSWIIDTYTTQVYHIGDKILTGGLSRWRVCTEEWFQDFGKDYEQEINFSVWNLIKFTKANIIRTIFGLDNKDRLDLELEMESELWNGNSHSQTFKLHNYEFDNYTGDELDEDWLTDDPEIKYTWSIASVQTPLIYAGKFIRFKYRSPNRFILWDSYFLTSESKLYANEIWTST